MPLAAGVKAVNLGSGNTVAPGWINIDNSWNARLSKYPLLRSSLYRIGLLSQHHYNIQWPQDLVIHDLTKKLPLPSNSVDYVYSSHALEHLNKDDAVKLLRDILRILKVGGVVRIVVPDLAVEARQYVEALETNPFDAQAAPRFLNGLALTRPPRLGRPATHQWMYDAPSLQATLLNAGFVHPIVCAYKQGRVPDIDILDRRPEISLYMEAERPASALVEGF
jgi:SAM-dependent methyltransferase